jgi:hypothetical protein
MKLAFQVLKYKEILMCLHNLEIQVTLDDLKKPTELSVASMFEQLVEIVIGVNEDVLSEPTMAGLDNIVNREMHGRSFGRIAIQKAMYVR